MYAVRKATKTSLNAVFYNNADTLVTPKAHTILLNMLTRKHSQKGG